MGRPARRLDARVVLGARSTRSTSSRPASRSRPPTATTAAGRSSRPRSTWRSSRRSSRPARRSAASTGRHVRLLDARDRARRLARALPRPPLQARPDARVDGRADRRARGPRQRRRGRPQGPVQGHGRRQPGRPRSLPARRRGLPGRVDRGPDADAGDRRGARAAPRPDHVGRADPLVGRRRGAAVQAEVPEREAVALRHARAAVRVLRALRGGGHRALRRRPVRAQRRPRPDPAPRRALLAPTGRTTWRPAATTRPSRATGLETSPLAPLPGAVRLPRAASNA